jgi:hypothetical protein
LAQREKIRARENAREENARRVDRSGTPKKPWAILSTALARSIGVDFLQNDLIATALVR